MNGKPLISIVSPCFNEELNIQDLYERVKKVTSEFKTRYDFEIIFIDNCSTDATVEKIKALIDHDKCVKLIVNTRNFGHIRSPYYGLLQSSGQATIYLASDLQDPPELISDFIEAWNEGYKVVMAVKPASNNNKILFTIRSWYYWFVDLISEAPVIRDATGFGLYDHCVIDQIRTINDPYPFFRALVAELGYSTKVIEFCQPRRLRGISKNNFYTLYDIAWLGIASHSKVPLRIASILGLVMSFMSAGIAILYLILKLIFWDNYPVGFAPVVIGMFFMFGVQFFLIGILGEYIGIITGYLQKRPIVVEAERINFDKKLEKKDKKNE